MTAFAALLVILGVVILIGGGMVSRVNRAHGAHAASLDEREIRLATETMGGSAGRRARELRFMQEHPGEPRAIGRALYIVGALCLVAAAILFIT